MRTLEKSSQHSKLNKHMTPLHQAKRTLCRQEARATQREERGWRTKLYKPSFSVGNLDSTGEQSSLFLIEKYMFNLENLRCTRNFNQERWSYSVIIYYFDYFFLSLYRNTEWVDGYNCIIFIFYILYFSLLLWAFS